MAHVARRYEVGALQTCTSSGLKLGMPEWQPHHPPTVSQVEGAARTCTHVNV